MQPRETTPFSAGELAVVLSHYDLGVIESVTDFPRGSRRHPKVGIVAERGKFLLKRRSVTRVLHDRIRLAHRLQAHLQRFGFPIAKLITTREGERTVVQFHDHVYELFEFVAGQPYTQTPTESQEAGVLLARFHQATDSFVSSPHDFIPEGDYHDAAAIRTGLCAIGSTLSSHDSFSGDEAELAGLTQHLLTAYDAAADAVNQLGFAGWPEQMIHSDWHPGNIIFRNQKVAAVVDYDSVRRSRRAIDVGNGVLQFSIMASGDPATWPDHVDRDRFAAFLSGYESLLALSPAERNSLPHLMAEALIAECVPPITETGSVGRWSGFRILQMVRRKLSWLTEHGGELGV